MDQNPLRALWAADKCAINGWLSMPSAVSAEIMANAGWDTLTVDMQHGMVDYQTAVSLMQAAATRNVTPLVRVPWNEPWIMMKVLDAGAYGVIVPLVNNRAEAERAVAACKYPPNGMRSFGPVRAGMYGGPDYAQHANDEIAVIVMIETAEGLANLEEIVTTPGVDCAYIGPADLSYAIGITPFESANSQEHADTVVKIRESCKKAGIAAGIHTASLSQSQQYLKDGFNMVTLGTDTAWMGRLARRELAAARDETHTEKVDPTGY